MRPMLRCLPQAPPAPILPSAQAPKAWPAPVCPTSSSYCVSFTLLNSFPQESCFAFLYHTLLHLSTLYRVDSLLFKSNSQQIFSPKKLSFTANLPPVLAVNFLDFFFQNTFLYCVLLSFFPQRAAVKKVEKASFQNLETFSALRPAIGADAHMNAALLQCFVKIGLFQHANAPAAVAAAGAAVCQKTIVFLFCVGFPRLA